MSDTLERETRILRGEQSVSKVNDQRPLASGSAAKDLSELIAVRTNKKTGKTPVLHIVQTASVTERRL